MSKNISSWSFYWRKEHNAEGPVTLATMLLWCWARMAHVPLVNGAMPYQDRLRHATTPYLSVLPNFSHGMTGALVFGRTHPADTSCDSNPKGGVNHRCCHQKNMSRQRGLMDGSLESCSRNDEPMKKRMSCLMYLADAAVERGQSGGLGASGKHQDTQV